jgi:hypothetical protein
LLTVALADVDVELEDDLLAELELEPVEEADVVRFDADVELEGEGAGS